MKPHIRLIERGEYRGDWYRMSIKGAISEYIAVVRSGENTWDALAKQQEVYVGCLSNTATA
jgi:hypothetical protein